MNWRKLIERLTITGVGVTGVVTTLLGSGIGLNDKINNILMWPGYQLGTINVSLLFFAGLGTLYVFMVYLKKNVFR